MPLRDVRDAMHEAKAHGWSRKQAVAIGLKAQREDRGESPTVTALRKLLTAKPKGPKIPTLVDALSKKRDA